MSFETQAVSDRITQAEVFKQFNFLVEYRRSRLDNTSYYRLTNLYLLLSYIRWFAWYYCDNVFYTRSFMMHFWMTFLLSILIGLMVFLVGKLD